MPLLPKKYILAAGGLPLAGAVAGEGHGNKNPRNKPALQTEAVEVTADGHFKAVKHSETGLIEKAVKHSETGLIEKEEGTSAFTRMDTNGDGVVSPGEFIEMDKDGDGAVSFAEFQASRDKDEAISFSNMTDGTQVKKAKRACVATAYYHQGAPGQYSIGCYWIHVDGNSKIDYMEPDSQNDNEYYQEIACSSWREGGTLKDFQVSSTKTLEGKSWWGWFKDEAVADLPGANEASVNRMRRQGHPVHVTHGGECHKCCFKKINQNYYAPRADDDLAKKDLDDSDAREAFIDGNGRRITRG